MSRTKKPCPSCKEKQIWYRDADDICENCKRDKKRLAYLEEAFAKINGETVKVYYSAAPHWNQYFHTHESGSSGKNGRKLQDAFYKLAEAISSPYTGEEFEGTLSLLGEGSGSSSGYGSGKRGTVRRDVAEAFIELHQCIQPILDDVHKDSYQQGNNLLLRLASGDLSPNDYLVKSG